MAPQVLIAALLAVASSDVRPAVAQEKSSRKGLFARFSKFSSPERKLAQQPPNSSTSYQQPARQTAGLQPGRHRYDSNKSMPRHYQGVPQPIRQSNYHRPAFPQLNESHTADYQKPLYPVQSANYWQDHSPPPQSVQIEAPSFEPMPVQPAVNPAWGQGSGYLRQGSVIVGNRIAPQQNTATARALELLDENTRLNEQLIRLTRSNERLGAELDQNNQLLERARSELAEAKNAIQLATSANGKLQQKIKLLTKQKADIEKKLHNTLHSIEMTLDRVLVKAISVPTGK